MLQAVASSYRRLLVGWVDGVRRAALVVVLLAVAATVGAGWFVGTHMSIDTNTTDMLSPDLPFRRYGAAVSEAFPQFSDNILVVVDGDNPDLADDAANLLAGEMRRKTDLFGAIFDAAGDPYFRRNGLLYLDTDELGELADRLAEAQPFLGALWRDPSLRGLFGMLGLVIDEVAREGDAPIEIDRVLEAMADVAEAQAAGRFARLSWRELMTGRGAEVNERRRLILIQPALDFGSLQPASDAMDALRGMIDRLHLTPDRGVRVRLTGSAALAQEELESVEEGMGLAAILSLTLVVGLLLFGLRSVRLAAAVLATLIMGLIWTAAVALAMVGQLQTSPFALRNCWKALVRANQGALRKRIPGLITEILRAARRCPHPLPSGLTVHQATDLRTQFRDGTNIDVFVGEADLLKFLKVFSYQHGPPPFT